MGSPVTYDYTAQGKAARAAREANSRANQQTKTVYQPQDPSAAGGTSLITKPAYEQQEQTKLQGTLAGQAEAQRAALNQQIWNQRFAQIQGLQSSGGANPGAAVSHSGVAGNEAGARAAAFARAKEQAGQNAQAALSGLQDVMGRRGLRGSTIEGGATADVINNGANNVNNYTRDQMIMDLNRSADISDMTYQGNIQQRAQNIQAQQQAIQSLYGLMGSGSLY